MAIAILPAGVLEDPPSPNQVSGAPTYGTTQLLIDAADEKAAVLVFQSPETCTVSHAAFAVRTVTTGATVGVRVEEVTGAGAFPTGNLANANSETTQVILSTDDSAYFICDLTADASLVEGNYYSLVIVNPSTSFGNMQVACFGDEQAHMPYSALYTTSWATVVGMRPIAYLRKSDGTALFIPGALPMSGFNSTAFSSSTNPNHRALYSRRPYPARVRGFWVWADLDGDVRVSLVDPAWDGTSGNALATLLVDKDVRGTTSGGIHYLSFPSNQRPVVAANAWTRLVFQPTTTTSITLYEIIVMEAAAMGAMPGGVDYRLSYANNPVNNASWTEPLTQRPWAGLLLDGFDDGVQLPPPQTGMIYVS